MGEYARINKLIAALEKERQKIQQEIDERLERLEEIRVEIGECEGYLAELEWIDNHNDPDWVPGTRREG